MPDPSVVPPLTIEDAQALLKTGEDYDDMLACCASRGIDTRWAALLTLLDRRYMEVQLWANGDFGNHAGTPELDDGTIAPGLG